jgi:hypothetical protein
MSSIKDWPAPSLEQLEQVITFLEPVIPCVIEPYGRPPVCHLPEDQDHMATWEVLFTCGCAMAYCELAFEWLTTNFEELRTRLVSWGHPASTASFECNQHGYGVQIVTMQRLP